jgi:hypothetical protein
VPPPPPKKKKSKSSPTMSVNTKWQKSSRRLITTIISNPGLKRIDEQS